MYHTHFLFVYHWDTSQLFSSLLRQNSHTIKFTQNIQFTVFSYIYRVVQPSPQSKFRIFSSASKETLYPLAITPQPLLTTNLLSMLIDLPILNLSTHSFYYENPPELYHLRNNKTFLVVKSGLTQERLQSKRLLQQGEHVHLRKVHESQNQTEQAFPLSGSWISKGAWSLGLTGHMFCCQLILGRR